MAYWLLKSEPSVYSWDRLVKEGRAVWDGVRNHQAAKNLRTMQEGDLAFFYHSNEDRAIVGVVKIVRSFYPDATDPTGRFVAVDIAPVVPLEHPLTLAQLKTDPTLADMPLIRQSRLSVSAITPQQWHLLCDRGGVTL